MIEIALKKEASKKLKRINPKDQQKALIKIELLGKDPLAGKPLQGEFKGLRSFRAWPLRIIYTYNSVKKVIIIEDIDYRGGVYK